MVVLLKSTVLVVVLEALFVTSRASRRSTRDVSGGYVYNRPSIPFPPPPSEEKQEGRYEQETTTISEPSSSPPVYLPPPLPSPPVYLPPPPPPSPPEYLPPPPPAPPIPPTTLLPPPTPKYLPPPQLSSPNPDYLPPPGFPPTSPELYRIRKDVSEGYNYEKPIQTFSEAAVDSAGSMKESQSTQSKGETSGEHSLPPTTYLPPPA